MSTHVPGFQPCFRFLHHFVLANLVTSSIRVKAIITAIVFVSFVLQERENRYTSYILSQYS